MTVACEPAAPRADPAPALPVASEPRDTRPVVAFLGTSLTAGLGVPSDQSFPALIQRRVDEEVLGFRVINAGVSGDTSAGGLRRIDWLLRQPVGVLVLELGANDMLRGQDLAAMHANLQEIIDRTLSENGETRIVIAGMRAAPNLGDAYADAFARVFADLALENRAAFIPFLLDGVAAVQELNQVDGIHPNAAGHRAIADNVWKVLGPVLQQMKAP